jgi:hypothetical protein
MPVHSRILVIYIIWHGICLNNYNKNDFGAEENKNPDQTGLKSEALTYNSILSATETEVHPQNTALFYV